MYSHSPPCASPLPLLLPLCQLLSLVITTVDYLPPSLSFLYVLNHLHLRLRCLHKSLRSSSPTSLGQKFPYLSSAHVQTLVTLPILPNLQTAPADVNVSAVSNETLALVMF